MSHISKIELVIHSLEDLKEACRQLGFEFMKNQKTTRLPIYLLMTTNVHLRLLCSSIFYQQPASEFYFNFGIDFARSAAHRRIQNK